MKRIAVSLRAPIGWRLVLLASTAAWLQCALPAPAEDPKTSKGQNRATVARSISEPGSLLERTGEPSSWRVLPAQTDISTGQPIMALPGQRGTIALSKQHLQVTLAGNLPQLSPAPVLDSTVQSNLGSEDAAALTLLRGRIVIANTASNKPGELHVQFAGQSWQLGLEPGAEMVLEVFSHWPNDEPFNPEVRADETLFRVANLWIIKGQGTVHVSGQQFSVHEPPGPAYFHWDSVHGEDHGPRRLDQSPAWLIGRTPPEADAVKRTLDQQRQALARGSVEEVIQNQLHSKNELEHQLAMYDLAALGNVASLVESLSDAQHADIRAAAAQALRYWIGLGSHQQQMLYDFLTKRGGYSSGQAEILMQLLRRFPANQRRQPETYEALIAYLRHPKLAIRELARDQLYDWVPAGRDIHYDPAASPQDLEQAYREWKKLIPEHQLPPRPRAVGNRS